MLDMGGVAPASADTRIDVGKNNRVRAVALDFNLITRSIEERRRIAEEEENQRVVGGSEQKPAGTAPLSRSAVRPDASLVEKMASLLNVNLGGDASKPKRGEQDDLSRILGGGGDKENATIQTKATAAPRTTTAPPHVDIRSKYASRLRDKIEGGVAGLERAKSEGEQTMRRGDASVHLAARGLLSREGTGQQSSNPSSSRWLAGTGVGRLLSFLSGRSMQIALLPVPSTDSLPQSDEDVERTSREMDSLARQLPHVKFDLLVPDGRRRDVESNGGRANDNAAEYVLKKQVLSKLGDVPPIKLVVVSDRDDYLRAARDAGMFTCRVRPKNRRRGDVTTNYNVEDVSGVLDVVNDINGVSFNSALKG